MHDVRTLGIYRGFGYRLALHAERQTHLYKSLAMEGKNKMTCDGCVHLGGDGWCWRRNRYADGRGCAKRLTIEQAVPSYTPFRIIRGGRISDEDWQALGRTSVFPTQPVE